MSSAFQHQGSVALHCKAGCSTRDRRAADAASLAEDEADGAADVATTKDKQPSEDRKEQEVRRDVARQATSARETEEVLWRAVGGKP